MQHSENTVQSPNAVSMTGRRRRLRVNIETALVACHLFAQIIQFISSVLSLIISWTFRSLAHEEDQYTDFFVYSTETD